jgi:hypothetical protein
MTRWIGASLAYLVMTTAAISCNAQRAKIVNPPPLTEDGECTGQGQLPANVLKVVLETKAAHEALPRGDLPTNSTELFKASKIELGPGRSGLLVCGLGEMSGADNNWYWIVATPYTQPRVVLFENSDGVSLMRHTHHGYRDIYSGWAVAARSSDKTFRFNGIKYVLASQQCYVPAGLRTKRVPCH